MACLATPLRLLRVAPHELNLATVLKSGQSFRWARFDQLLATRLDEPGPKRESMLESKLGPELSGVEWACGLDDRTICLRQEPHGIYYRSLFNTDLPHTAFIADLELDTTLPLLLTYFNLAIPLAPLYADWSARDPHFRAKILENGNRLEGIRVLKQDSWETLCAFVCSSNNNIARIGQMVNKLCLTLGARLPHPTSFTAASLQTPLPLSSYVPASSSKPVKEPEYLYSFPSPLLLTNESTPDLLRAIGFGYRARFVHETSLLLVAKSTTAGLSPSAYLDTLSHPHTTLPVARAALLEFVGVGRKVADCVLLFGLGFTGVVPVDTHVFQIAIRDYHFPASKCTALSLVLHNRVEQKFRELFGERAGWAQQVLFFADLASTKNEGNGSPKKVKREKVEEEEEKSPVKAKWELELEKLMLTPTKRGGRSSTTGQGSPATPRGKQEERESPTKKTKKEAKIVVVQLRVKQEI